MKKIFGFVVFIILVLLFTGCSDFLDDLKENVDDFEVEYTVEYWQQSLDGNSYDEITALSSVKKGMSHALTNVHPENIDGFTAKAVNQKKIKRDGSTVIDVYYDRKTITYSFNCNGGKWTDNQNQKQLCGLYGQEVPDLDSPGKTGYDFNNWGESIPQVFGTDNKTFNANWLPRSDTLYKVEHYQQNINDDLYTLYCTDDCRGSTEADTEASPKSYAGFSAKDFNQTVINADGSSVVQIYYDRNNIEYTFTTTVVAFADNTTSKTLSGRYGASFNAPVIQARTGYSGAWNSTVPSTFGDTNTTFTTKWTANTYKITFNGNGGSGSTATQTFTYDSSQSLRGNSFTRTNWGFKCWNTASNGTGTTYTPGQNILNLTATNGAEIKLYAIWTYPQTLSYPDKKFPYVCDTISLTYTITVSAPGYSKSFTFSSGSATSEMKLTEVPQDAVKNGAVWTFTVVAVNSSYGLRYTGSGTSTVSGGKLTVELPHLTKN